MVLLSIHESIKGYSDDSLNMVKQNSVQYDMALEIVGFDVLYEWTLDTGPGCRRSRKKIELRILWCFPPPGPQSGRQSARHEARCHRS